MFICVHLRFFFSAEILTLRYFTGRHSSDEMFYRNLPDSKLFCPVVCGSSKEDARLLQSRFTANAVSSLKINYLEEKVVASPNKKW
jgi:hypothetical protein